MTAQVIGTSTLLEDGHDHREQSVTPRRIVVVGSSGAGKSTMAAALSQRLGLPHIELDALRHGPNWVEVPD
ncbi:MAG TPA: AAA family ATPase, partial [Armatimonadota bacterium]|nr:AAA family ATPase [Armatimonadota bacterium]